MSFLSDFEDDVLISYAHVDDQSLTEGQKGWIANFHRKLKIRLSQLLDAEPKVRLEPSPDRTDELRSNGHIPRIGVLVSVVSPPYVSSESCRKEIREFYKIAEQTGGVRIDDQPRIFKVVKLPVPSEKQPREIQGLIDYDFYQIEKQSGFPREMDPEVDPGVRQSYWLKLDDLAHDIHQMLEKLKNGKNDHPTPATVNPVINSKRVFISHASEDSAAAEEICNLLEDQGIKCWIAQRDMPMASEYAEEIIDNIDNAAALVLILSKNSNASVHVTNEIEWATSSGKPICTIRIEDVQPSKRFALHIHRRHWVNAWVPPLDAKVTLLAATISKLIGSTAAASVQDTNVYLAEATFDLKDERDCIRRELQQRGYNILPDKSLPSNAADFKQAVREYVERSRLSVHFIGENYGDIPSGETRSLVDLQNELAAQRSGEPEFSRLIWMPPGLQVQDPRQRKFIESLRYDVNPLQGAELLETPLEELKAIIEDTLKSRTQTQPPPATPGSPMHVYLICDQEDVASASPIRDYLYEHQYEAFLPAMTGDEAQIREDHKESLLTCDACLIYYGAANEFWLRSKLRDLQKSAGYGRAKPILAKTVYIAAPERSDKDNFKTLDALVIRNFGAFNADSLRPFLMQLAPTQTARGAGQ